MVDDARAVACPGRARGPSWPSRPTDAWPGLVCIGNTGPCDAEARPGGCRVLDPASARRWLCPRPGPVLDMPTDADRGLSSARPCSSSGLGPNGRRHSAEFVSENGGSRYPVHVGLPRVRGDHRPQRRSRRGLRGVAARRRRRHARAGDQRQRRVRVPRGRPRRTGPRLPVRGAARRPHRRAGRLSRSRRVRPPLHRRHARGPRPPTSSTRSARCRHSPTPPARRSATSNPMARCTTRSSPITDQATRRRRGRARRRPRVCPCSGWPARCSSPAPNELGLRTVAEAFADRAYRPDGQLVSRREPGAVLHDADADRRPGGCRWSTTGRVAAVDGSTIAISVESVCVHGDSPGAVQIATAVRERLTADGIALAAFT